MVTLPVSFGSEHIISCWSLVSGVYVGESAKKMVTLNSDFNNETFFVSSFTF